MPSVLLSSHGECRSASLLPPPPPPSQAAELGEFTAKIALLEEAKRKKEEEATEWQHKVTHNPPKKQTPTRRPRLLVLLSPFLSSYLPLACNALVTGQTRNK